MIDNINQTIEKLKAGNPERVLGRFSTDVFWNKNSLAGVADFGRINWQSRRAGTLIAPRIMISATHYEAPATGRFYGYRQPNWTANGEPYEREGRKNVRPDGKNTDIILSLLKRPKNNIDYTYIGQPYRILGNAVGEGQSFGVIVTDQEGKAFFGEGEIRNGHFTFSQLDEQLVSGDSSHPTFVPIDHGYGIELALVGVHWTTSGKSCACAALARAEMNLIAAEWGVDPPKFVDSVNTETDCRTDAEVLKQHNLEVLSDGIKYTPKAGCTVVVRREADNG